MYFKDVYFFVNHVFHEKNRIKSKVRFFIKRQENNKSQEILVHQQNTRSGLQTQQDHFLRGFCEKRKYHLSVLFYELKTRTMFEKRDKTATQNLNENGYPKFEISKKSPKCLKIKDLMQVLYFVTILTRFTFKLSQLSKLSFEVEFFKLQFYFYIADENNIESSEIQFCIQ